MNGTPTSLKSPLVALLCRPDMAIWGAGYLGFWLDMSFLILVVIMSSQNSRGQVATLNCQHQGGHIYHRQLLVIRMPRLEGYFPVSNHCVSRNEIDGSLLDKYLLVG